MAGAPRRWVKLTFGCWGLSRNLSAAWCVRGHDSDSRTLENEAEGKATEADSPSA
jgi:hypothetical protein